MDLLAFVHRAGVYRHGLVHAFVWFRRGLLVLWRRRRDHYGESPIPFVFLPERALTPMSLTGFGIRVSSDSCYRSSRTSSSNPRPRRSGQEAKRAGFFPRSSRFPRNPWNVDSSPLEREVVSEACHVWLYTDSQHWSQGEPTIFLLVSSSRRTIFLFTSTDFLVALLCFFLVQAALIMGHPFRAVPVVSEDGFSLRGDALRAVMEEDRAAGLVRRCRFLCSAASPSR